MSFVVTRILDFITKQGIIGTEEEVQDFYRYGIEISISSFLNIALVLILGLVLSHFPESVIYLTLFIFIRSFTGGYHADTYFRCNLLMCVLFILVILLNKTAAPYMTSPAYLCLICLSEIIILSLGPIENKNKPISESKKKVLKIVGFVVSAALNTAGIILIDTRIGSTVIFTCLIIAILMIAAMIKEKRGEKNEEDEEGSC